MICSSRNCCSLTPVGASAIRSIAFAVFGKVITSRKLGAPVSNITMDIPVNRKPPTSTVIIVVDSNHKVIETDEDNNAATVKKIYRERDGRIRLQPANDAMLPIYVHENDVTIQGVVVGVLRKY